MSASINSTHKNVAPLHPDLLQLANCESNFQKPDITRRPLSPTQALLEYENECLKDVCEVKIRSIFETLIQASKTEEQNAREDCIMHTFSLLQDYENFIRNIEFDDACRLVEIDRSLEMTFDINPATLRNVNSALDKTLKINRQNYLAALNQNSQSLDHQPQAKQDFSVEKSLASYQLALKTFRGLKRLYPERDPSKPAIWRSLTLQGDTKVELSEVDIKQSLLKYYDSVTIIGTKDSENAPEASSKRHKKINFNEIASVRAIPVTDFAKNQFDRMYEIYDKLKNYHSVDPITCPNSLMSNITCLLGSLAQSIINQEPEFQETIKILNPDLFGSAVLDLSTNSDQDDFEKITKLHLEDKQHESFKNPSEWHEKIKFLTFHIPYFEARLENISKAIDPR